MGGPRYEGLKSDDDAESWTARGSAAADPEEQRVPEPGSDTSGNQKHSPFVRLCLKIVLLFLLILAVIVTQATNDRHTPRLSLGEMRNGSYSPKYKEVAWLENGENGQIVDRRQDGFFISHWESQDKTSLVAPLNFEVDGSKHLIQKFTLNKQQTYALVATEIQKHWRHSTYAHYWILDVKSQEFRLLHPDALSIAQWSPSGDLIAYVRDHNIYVYDISKGQTTQVTSDGGEEVFNGIPDWVYEEEVLAGDSALFWSPQSKYIGFIRTNDSLVPKFPIPYFMGSGNEKSENTHAYPELVEIKYPKPGYPNPKVEFWVHDVAAGTPRQYEIPTTLHEPIITEVIWVGEQAVVKIMNRESDFMEAWIIDPVVHKIERSRAYSSEELGGAWFEVTHNSHAVGSEGYIDTIDVQGYNHLGFFTPANSTEPIVLTRGDWEVQDTSIAVNLATRHVYFHATKRASTESTLYRVSLDEPTSEPELVGFEGEGVYVASFSGDATFATVAYTSPTAPLVQKIVKLSQNPEKKHSATEGKDSELHFKEWRLEENKELFDFLKERKLLDKQNVIYGTVDLGNGTVVNYREIRPTGFSKWRKHPLLFFNYGGPGSQQVQKRLSLDFQRVFAETHNAVIVTVDPRGTGNRGRQFRAGVRDHLGEYEADDVIAVAKIWNKKRYIDSRTTAIWGWSYGGFLTLKTLERDTDLAFKYGVAVAPVTDWALYDSVYTERYMHEPQHNPHGYSASAIRNVTNIGAHDRFLIMHGTGDDNVHFQNTLSLLDKFDLAGVENYDVHVFPDSDHSIYFHNANAVVYDKIDRWLGDEQSKAQHHRRWRSKS